MNKFLVSLLVLFSVSFGATYYCHLGLATGDDNGTTSANAWRTLQKAVDGTNGTQPTAGDMVLVYNQETTTANVDFDGPNGTRAGGYVKFVGVNSSWVNDGTRFKIAAGTGVERAIVGTSEYLWIENAELCDADQWGIFNLGTGSMVIRCYIHDNGLDGIYITNTTVSVLNCKSSSNGRHGIFYSTQNSYFEYDTLIQNANCAIDFDDQTYQTVKNCIIHDNGNGYTQIRGVGNSSKIINNVIDGTDQTNDTGLTFSATCFGAKVVGNRFTNMNLGIKGVGTIGEMKYNYFDDNTTDTLVCAKLSDPGISSTNLFNLDVDDGYTNVGAHNFSIKASRTYNGQCE
jgi:hypothetical protein